MTDREKVIEHLKEIAEYFRGCRSNASFASKAEIHFWELQNAASEAAELLKAHEPVEPDVDVDTWICGKCGHKLEHQEMVGSNILFHEQYSYCPNCGRKVKWDD